MRPAKGCLFVALLSGLLVGCGGVSDCGVADVVQEIRQVEVGAVRYHLYLRTSGVSDKTRFLVLYDRQPAFDRCGVADREAVGEAVLDDGQGRPLRVVLADGQLDVQYAAGSGGDRGVPPDIALEISAAR